MDTSETYIKMCDCEKIQGKWKPCQGDMACVKYQSNIIAEGIVRRVHRVLGVTEDSLIMSGMIEIPDKNGIWLPRQDQLQEMILEDENYERYQRYQSDARWLDLTKDVDNFFEAERVKGRAGLIASMEQLWLAFVMKEKYNKIWDGDKWRVNNGR